MSNKPKLIYHIANILTLFRVILVPFFIYSIFGSTVISGFIALILFLLASISDYYDGYFARKYKIESRFGEFFDPLADKMLIGGAFISFAILPDFSIPFWLVFIILAREIFVTLLRVVAIKKSRPVKTEYSGKIKTAFQMCTIIIILILLLIKKLFLSIRPGVAYESSEMTWIRLFGQQSGVIIYYLPLILVMVSASIALFSMIQYIMKNRRVLFSFNK